MNFDVHVADSIEEIGQDAWDRCSPGQAFSSYRWFSFCQRVMADCPAIHIQLSLDSEPVARGSFWLMRRENLPVPAGFLQPFSEAAIRRWPLCICRSPVANRSALVLPPGSLQRPALETIQRTIERYARKKGASFVLYDYLDANLRALQKTARRLAWMPVDNPGTALALRWPDFEHYLFDLGKGAYKDYRRHNNRAADLGLELTRLDRVTNVDEALELIRAVEERHDSVHFPWAREVLENCDMLNGSWIEVRSEGRLAGCGLLLSDGDEMVATLLGLDYRVKFAYFQVMYAAVRCAIERGMRVLHAGSGAYELKHRLGFVLERNNHIAYAGCGPFFGPLGRLAALL